LVHFAEHHLFSGDYGCVWLIALEENGNQSLTIIEVIDENKLFFLESSEQYAFSFSIQRRGSQRTGQNGERYGFFTVPKIDLKISSWGLLITAQRIQI